MTPTAYLETHPVLAAFALVLLVVASARATRLFTQDVYPPVARLRAAWQNLVHRRKWDEEWAVLATCPYCAAFWITAVDVLWLGLLVWFTGDIHWTWWLVNLIFAAAYAAAMVVVRDGE